MRSVEMTQITIFCRTILRFWGPSVQFWDTSKVHSEKQTWNWNTWTLNEYVGVPFAETDMKSSCQPVITSIFHRSHVKIDSIRVGAVVQWRAQQATGLAMPMESQRKNYMAEKHVSPVPRILTLQESLCRHQSLSHQLAAWCMKRRYNHCNDYISVPRITQPMCVF